MPVDPKIYRPPFTTQWGIDSTLNDCAVVATIHGIADASSGEYVTLPNGRTMGRAALHAMANKMRASLQPADSDGLSALQRQQMCVNAGYPKPKLVDATFSDVKAWLVARKFGCSISGNPADIVGDSPLKRCDAPHEWYAWGGCPTHKDRVIIYDGLRPWGKRATLKRGECRPFSELRQMCFKNSDGAVNDVLLYPVGGWTKAMLSKDSCARTVRDLERRIKNLQQQIDEAPNGDCTNKIAAALERERTAIRDWVDDRRTL